MSPIPPKMQEIQAKKMPRAICRASAMLAPLKRLLMTILYAGIEGRYRTLGLLFLGLWFATAAHAQVSIGPWVVPQYFDNNGRPCAGCKLASFAAGTTSPQATYSDPDGTFPNSNPIILDSSGRARVYLTGLAYKLVLSDASNNQIWSVDEVVSSNNGLLTSNNTWLGTQTFQATTNFNGQANFNVGFTSLGPNNLGGGGSMSGTFSGSPTFSGTPNFAGGAMGTNLTLSGQLAVLVATGTAPFFINSQTQVGNLNASFLEGFTWEQAGPIGVTTPNVGDFTSLHANTNFVLNGSAAQTSIQGGAGDVKLLSAGAFSGATGTGLCKDANGGATTSGCAGGGFTAISLGSLTGPSCTTGSSSYDTCTSVVTIAPTQADTNYIPFCSGITPSDPRALIQTVSGTSVSSITATVVTEGSVAVNFGNIQCMAIHP